MLASKWNLYFLLKNCTFSTEKNKMSKAFSGTAGALDIYVCAVETFVHLIYEVVFGNSIVNAINTFFVGREFLNFVKS